MHDQGFQQCIGQWEIVEAQDGKIVLRWPGGIEGETFYDVDAALAGVPGGPVFDFQGMDVSFIVYPPIQLYALPHCHGRTIYHVRGAESSSASWPPAAQSYHNKPVVLPYSFRIDLLQSCSNLAIFLF